MIGLPQIGIDWRRLRVCAGEISVVSLLGLLPPVLATLRLSVGAKEAELNSLEAFWATTVSTFGAGQLFLYAFSIWGTLIWLMINGVRGRFGFARGLILCVLFVMALGVSGIGIFDPSFQTKNQLVVQLSYWCYGITIASYFVLLWMSVPSEVDLGDELANGSKKLEERYRQELGGVP